LGRKMGGGKAIFLVKYDGERRIEKAPATK
jgi:hypothetical protein